jgi:hypothetical protein
MKKSNQFLSWLADFQMENCDRWDEELARDSQVGGGWIRFSSAFGATSLREGPSLLMKSFTTS